MTLQFGVMGWPVRHSLSPAMQEAAFAALRIDARYRLIATPPAQVEATVRHLAASGFSGWNVTVPHKQAVSECMDRLDQVAALAASVNTVTVDRRDRTMTGYSTDGYGLEMALREHFDFDPAGSRIAFIGGGGAAGATAIHLALQGADQMVLINRTLTRIEQLAALIGRAAPQCRVTCVDLADRMTIQRTLQTIPLLIQATSLGLQPRDPLPIPVELVPPSAAVMDMIYGNTPFLQQLAGRGCRTADGTAMLIHQGARSFTLWTGRPAPLAAMRQALRLALRKRSREPQGEEG